MHMKKTLTTSVVLALVAATPLVSVADLFFSDDFSTSTLNQVPAAPTATSTSYENISSKSRVPTPTISTGDLKFGIAATTSGSIEVQALFATGPKVLVVPGDYIEMTLTFTNTAGVLTGSGAMGFGLYNSGQVFPLAGGLNGTATTGTTTNGGAQMWQGYVGQLGYSGSNSRIMTRPAQGTVTTANNQDLVTSGSGSSSYTGQSTVGSASSAPSVTLVAGQTYTENLKITLTDVNTLAITNSLYAGVGTGGTMLSQFGGVASGGTFITAGFDALAIGWRQTQGSIPTTIDISSIQVSGQVTPVTAPPDIVTQPSAVSVPAGAACNFSVAASGYSMTYQWHRYGTNLVNGGNISGATSPMLVISPASAADVASGANGYSVTINGAGGFSTNSVTVPLSLRTAANLVWSGTGTDWDLNTTADWLNGAAASVFNFGDNVTFDDTPMAEQAVSLTYNFLSAGSVTVNASINYGFSGTGSFAGPGKLLFIGGGHLTLNNANTYTGGTLISNATAYLVLNNYNGLGSGPVTLAKAGGQMEISSAGGSSTGIQGDIVVQDDFTIMYDANSSYGAVFFGNLSGTAGKTLTLTHNNLSPTASRIRVAGTNTVCAANIVINNAETTFASYQGSGSQTYNGMISGWGSFMQKGTTTYLNNGLNTYSGGTFPASGTIGLGADSVGTTPDSGPIGTGPLYLAPDSTTSTTGSGTILAWGGARTIANPIQYPSATNNQTLIVGGTNALTLSGPITLNGNDFVTPVYTSRIFQVNNTALTTFSGLISDSGMGFGLVKTGTGVLDLSNAETYTGPTAVSNGTLRVTGQLGAGAVTVATNGVLGGIGTIGGPVTVLAGGSIAPGNSIGTLTINNNLTLAGNLNVEINKSASPNSDQVSVSGTLNNTGTGTVTVTNLGPSLAPGDSFMLFSNNKPLANGAALTITGGGAIWTNKLATDGTIAVVAPIATTPTNISYALSGNSLTLSWPFNYITWTLQSNSVSVVSSSNWFAVPNSASATQITVTVDPAKSGVFYRLVAP